MMAQIFLAILLVLVCAHATPDLVRVREFGWLDRLLGWWTRSSGDDARPRFAAIWLPLAVFLACVLVQFALAKVMFGLPAFAFAFAVLFYCWGPRDLDADIEAVLKAPDGDRRSGAVQALRPDPAVDTLPLQAAPIVEATFLSALSRWFGVLFWFVLLGPAGALAYRIVQLLARNATFRARIDAEQQAWLERAARVLDWAPAHLAALTLALVSDFDAVLGRWRDYHAAHGQGYFTLDLGFLGAIARAGVEADVVAGDGYATEVDDPLRALEDARTLLRRILVVWLALLALVVLAGWAV